MKKSQSASRLLAPWFLRERRSLPWRDTQDPYRIWVSEIMLQQTQVDTVIPYYQRFVQLYPTVHALAKAELESVLKAWEGLGYYARARNLHRAARDVVAGGGEVPSTWEGIRNLPGVGDYTAGAILSMAFGQAVEAVDGNVRRVLSRLFAEGGDPRQPETQQRLREQARLLVTAVGVDPSLHNQAMMELGALVCLPRRPRCEACPVARVCRAHEEGQPEMYPMRVARRKTPHYPVAVGAIYDGQGRLLIGLRPPKGLLGGLWELPGGKIEAGETAAEALQREAREELGIEIAVGEALPTVFHAYTHFKVTLHPFRCRWVSGEPRPIAVDEFRWVQPSELDRYPFPKANKTILERLEGV
ncbi:MAG TPA: A/G-specific adenine glycosylase [Candidatus Xenobia bacterium]